MASNSPYPSIPAPDYTIKGLFATVNALRQFATLLIVGATTPPATAQDGNRLQTFHSYATNVDIAFLQSQIDALTAQINSSKSTK